MNSLLVVIICSTLNGGTQMDVAHRVPHTLSGFEQVDRASTNYDGLPAGNYTVTFDDRGVITTRPVTLVTPTATVGYNTGECGK